MLVKFSQTVRLVLVRGNEEVLSRHPVNTIANVEEEVGEELVRRGVAISIPDREIGNPVHNS